MLDHKEISEDVAKTDTIIVESNNCKGQYKTAQHFYDMQDLANSLNKKVLRIYGVPGHGKGEVDHVGGIVKVAIRTSVAAVKHM